MYQVDPEVIRIGEIHDPASAEIARTAAAVGPQVWTTANSPEKLAAWEREGVVEHARGLVEHLLATTRQGRVSTV